MKSVKKSKPGNIREYFESLEARQLLSASLTPTASPSLNVLAAAASSSGISGYTPAQIKSAYGINSISFNGVKGDGSGQTIAIVDAFSDPNILSDLKTFDKQFSLSDPTFTQMSQTGSTTSLPRADAGWAQEISLDVEWAHAIAPRANIILVDAKSDTISNLMAAVNYARNFSGVSVVSMSWGSSEFSGETSYDKYFTTPAGHQGVTFVAASGDEGAAGGAEYPASSPNVLSVGGTTLSISSSGAVTGETAWSDSSGGTSRFEATPTFQAGISSTRSTPDVSFDANPNTGFAVYDSYQSGGANWAEVGGSSAGAPQWGALVAIADQGRVINGGASLDGATGTLPAIYSAYSNAATYTADFTDVTSGSSSLGGGFGFGHGRFGRGGFAGSVSASVGYDTLTGVGTPKAALVTTLSSVKASTASTAVKTSARSTMVLRAKAAAVAQTPLTNSYQSLSQLTLSFVGNRPQLSAVEALHATPLASLESGFISVDPATSAQRGTLVALSGFMVSNDEAQARSEGASMTHRVEETIATTAMRSVNALEHMAGALEAFTPAMRMPNILPSFNSMVGFRDGLDSLADEFASIGPAVQTDASMKAVKTAATVALAADLALVGYYYAKRSKAKRAAGDGMFGDLRIGDE